MKKYILIIAAFTLLNVNFAPAQGQGPMGTTKAIVLPPETVTLKSGKGLETVQMHCLICHSADYIQMQPPFSKAQWSAEVKKMITVMGAKINESDAGMISDYLADNYGSGM
jgi:sulfite dehydrogenase (cytochrome) subunit B